MNNKLRQSAGVLALLLAMGVHAQVLNDPFGDYNLTAVLSIRWTDFGES